MPKWDPRARMGIYVGRSPSHASTVGLILNPRTGHVSPQFHIVYNDNFTTVPYLRTGKVPPHWADLVCESSLLNLNEDQKSTWSSLSVDGPPDEGDFNNGPDSFSGERISEDEPTERDITDQASQLMNPKGVLSP